MRPASRTAGWRAPAPGLPRGAPPGGVRVPPVPHRWMAGAPPPPAPGPRRGAPSAASRAPPRRPTGCGPAHRVDNGSSGTAPTEPGGRVPAVAVVAAPHSATTVSVGAAVTATGRCGHPLAPAPARPASLRDSTAPRRPGVFPPGPRRHPRAARRPAAARRARRTAALGAGDQEEWHPAAALGRVLVGRRAAGWALPATYRQGERGQGDGGAGQTHGRHGRSSWSSHRGSSLGRSTGQRPPPRPVRQPHGPGPAPEAARPA
ncbi:hypothetical protein BKD26_05165 [Streptomyces sp. CB03238]|nr:hypothetical protein BKD26_05165 [Streptomyces sp. CB03238]